jgi:dTDP-4-amino-4,6-dideoxygalactose transaminase
LTCGEAVQDTTIVLPLFHQLTEDEQDMVIENLKSAVGERDG